MTAPRRPRWPWVVFAAVLGVLVIAPASVVLVRLTAPLPRPAVQISTTSTIAVGGDAPGKIPVPSRGSFALSASTLGTVASYNATVERPTGSVAKAMTALVVLDALPLAPGAAGPSRTMTAADVQLYRQAVAEGGSNLPVRAGEVLSERDLLLALLLPSADNIAESLAIWVSSNRTAFIARLNAKAAALGMARSHYADPSGLSNRTVSTAGDLVLLAKAVISNPTLAELVGVQQASLPDGTVLRNLDVGLQQDPDWLGIKTGWTGAAGGCLLFAASRSYGPTPAMSVTVYGAVLGQPSMTAPDPAHPELGAAFFEAENAVSALLDSYHEVDLTQTEPSLTGSVSTPWGGSTPVELLTAEGTQIVMIRGPATVQLSVTTFKPVVPLLEHTEVGEVKGVLNGTKVTWRVIISDAIAAPSWWWKLLNG
jgi:serine-type D-Ala-D-Ala carboxypeptidase (penicillin-binding protein 5/6)